MSQEKALANFSPCSGTCAAHLTLPLTWLLRLVCPVVAQLLVFMPLVQWSTEAPSLPALRRSIQRLDVRPIPRSSQCRVEWTCSHSRQLGGLGFGLAQTTTGSRAQVTANHARRMMTPQLALLKTAASAVLQWPAIGPTPGLPALHFPYPAHQSPRYSTTPPISQTPRHLPCIPPLTTQVHGSFVARYPSLFSVRRFCFSVQLTSWLRFPNPLLGYDRLCLHGQDPVSVFSIHQGLTYAWTKAPVFWSRDRPDCRIAPPAIPSFLEARHSFGIASLRSASFVTVLSLVRSQALHSRLRTAHSFDHSPPFWIAADSKHRHYLRIGLSIRSSSRFQATGRRCLV
jgi:hypothetical protein